MKVLGFKTFLFLLILLGGAISSCQSQTNRQETSTSNQADCRTIEHEVGSTQICGQPQKMIVLGTNVLEPLVALGIQPVAFGGHLTYHQSDFDNPKEQIPYLGSLITQPVANVGQAYEPSIEAIAKVQPDLIIGTQNNAQQYETLSQISPTILLDWFEAENNLRAIAQAVNRTQQAEQILNETEQRIANAREAFAPLAANTLSHSFISSLYRIMQIIFNSLYF